MAYISILPLAPRRNRVAAWHQRKAAENLAAAWHGIMAAACENHGMSMARSVNSGSGSGGSGVCHIAKQRALISI